MRRRFPISLVCLSLSWLAFAGCNGGDDEGTTDDEVGDGDGDTTAGTEDESGESGDTTDDTAETTVDESTETTADESTGDTTDETTDDTTDETTETTGGGCQAWQITYDLTDSEFEISGTPFGAGDQVNIVDEPYDDDDHIGPGTMVLFFQDVAGEPGGQAFISSYDMDINFVVSGATTVTTDLVTTGEVANDACALASGPLENDSVVWAPDEMADIHTMGTILCEGNLCMLGGLPNGMAVPVDDVGPQPTNPFDFDPDLGAFTMDQVVIAMDMQSTTSWTYTGTETDRELVDAPACICE